MAFVYDWNAAFAALPADAEDLDLGAEKIRLFKATLQERMDADHYLALAGVQADHGQHRQITFQAPIATPTAVADKGFVYMKDVGGKGELHYLDEDDQEVQLTSAGKIITTSLQFPLSQYDTIWIPAGAFLGRTTNGAGYGSNEYATNDIMAEFLTFDGATQQYAGVNLVMPYDWDRGTIKYKVYWAPGSAACTVGDGVVWQVQGLAIGNDDAIDAALGTEQIIADAVLVGENGDLHITGTSPALTIGGTPALEDIVHLSIGRKVAHASDDMTEDAWLFGVLMQYKRTNVIAAW